MSKEEGFRKIMEHYRKKTEENKQEIKKWLYPFLIFLIVAVVAESLS